MTKCVYQRGEYTPVRDLDVVKAVYIDNELRELDDLDEVECETCDDCGEYVPEDELTERDDEYYCTTCLDNHPEKTKAEEEEEDETPWTSPFVD